jgi:large subunit ribosomal protein L9
MVKLILRENVDHLGDRGEIVSVAPGYARNYLLPKGLAYEATPGNLKQIEHQRKVWATRDAHEIGEAEALAARMADVGLTSTKKAGESGTLYGSVTTGEIAEMLAAKGFGVDRRRIILAEPIKALGTYEIKIKIHRQVEGRVTLEVVPEGDAE